MGAGSAVRVLCLNSGSSSLKFALYEMDREEREVLSGSADGFEEVARELRATGAPVAGVGHRVVFGGDHVDPARVDASLMEELRGLSRFAPLHMPAGLALIDDARRALPDVPHVACFDTAFHHAMPDVARRLPLPQAMTAAGLRRFGFHGLSYEYVVSALGAAAIGRGVVAHLGSGASLAAIRVGRSIDTTMAVSPAGGIPMSTRSGDVDPGVVVYLARERGLSPDEIERCLTRDAGLIGLSGTTGDMQELLSRRSGDPRAAAAVEAFCYAVRKQIGAFAAALGGLDSLTFTGGIGEHAAPVRLEICRGLEHLGIAIDVAANARDAAEIHAPGASCRVHVVRTNENLMIARHTRRLIGATS